MPSFNPNPAKVKVYKRVPRVYILINEETLMLYVGYTTNLKRRLKEHRKGLTFTSARLGNPKELNCIKSWRVPNESIGLKLERKLQICVGLGLLNYKNFKSFDIHQKLDLKYKSKKGVYKC